jgi:hypothetical protein
MPFAVEKKKINKKKKKTCLPWVLTAGQFALIIKKYLYTARGKMKA